MSSGMQNKAVRFPTRNARDLSEYKEGGTMNALGQPQVLHQHSLSQAFMANAHRFVAV